MSHWKCSCGADWTPTNDAHYFGHCYCGKMIPNWPDCPRCGNNRQVWRNQLTGVMTCHRAFCDTVLDEPAVNQSKVADFKHSGSVNFNQHESVIPSQACKR